MELKSVFTNQRAKDYAPSQPVANRYAEHAGSRGSRTDGPREPQPTTRGFQRKVGRNLLARASFALLQVYSGLGEDSDDSRDLAA